MAMSRKPLSAQRLVEVSDAVLSASAKEGENMQSPSGHHVRRPRKRHPLEMMREGQKHPSLSRFTWAEIDEACRFLIRLGMMATPTPGSAT